MRDPDQGSGYTMNRPTAVAGTWYPGTREALTREVDDYLGRSSATVDGDIRAIIAPHAGIMFSGPVGAYAYQALAGRDFDVAVLVGPSHFVPFDGAALWPDGAFETPLGPARIDEEGARAMSASAVVQPLPSAHRREHSLEMQLPFLKRVLPDVPIVPLLIGFQHRRTIDELGTAMATAFAGRRALLVASTDLSHYFDARTASTLDSRVYTNTHTHTHRSHVLQLQSMTRRPRVVPRAPGPQRTLSARLAGCGE